METLEVRQFLSMTAPTALSADVVNGSRIDVAFTNANTTSDADAIEIERSLDGGTTWGLIVGLTPAVGTMTFEDTGRFPGEYVYRARARVWHAGLSADVYSTYAAADAATITLAAPTGLTATATSGSTVGLAFTNNADNADGFEVWRSHDGGTTWGQIDWVAATPGAMTYQDTGRYPGEYRYKVRARRYDFDRSEDDYTAFTGVATATINLNAPTNLAAAVTSAGDAVRVAFTNAADNASAIYVERSDDGGANWDQVASLTPAAGAMSFTDPGLDPDIYKYRARAATYDYDRSVTAYSSYTGVATATVYSTPPVVEATPQNTPYVGETFTIDLDYTGTGYGTISHWLIDWGDGTTPEVVTGNPGSAGHVYLAEGDFTVTAACANADGVFEAEPMQAQPQFPYTLSTVGATSSQLDVNDKAYFTLQLSYKGNPAAAEVQNVLIKARASVNSLNGQGLVFVNAVNDGNGWMVDTNTTDANGRFVIALSTNAGRPNFDRPLEVQFYTPAVVGFQPFTKTFTVLQ
ncbi:MAG TPA: hypothetical protein VEA69_22085 [Tepidisphaeraceae bacterium]|nr:hypothetical protein [Tepidisphaeraceae bacterium]